MKLFPLIPTSPVEETITGPTVVPGVQNDINCIANELNTQGEEEALRTQRRLNDAINFAESLDLPEAHEVASFLRNSTSTTQPSDSKVEVIAVEPNVPEPCDILEDARTAPIYGVFFQDVGALVLVGLNSDNDNSLWANLMVLHEGRHAELGLTGGTNEERDTRVFEQAIITEVGGEAYSNYLDELVSMVEQHNLDTYGDPMTFDRQFVIDVIDDSRLDQIFGSEVSAKANDTRKSSIAFHVIFQTMQRNDQPGGYNTTTIQQMFMDSLRAENGLD